MLDEIIKIGYSKTEAIELVKVSKDLKEDIKKLKNGYPIQYLIGYVNFYGNKILVDDNVLIPRYETELLVEKTIKLIRNHIENPYILEIGTGSGCISIALKKELNCDIDATDISNEALNVAKKNSELNGTKINFIHSDLYEKLSSKYDVIISNPPYISYDEKIMDLVYDNEPHIALFANDNGLYYYNKILEFSKKFLNKKNIIAFEIGENQSKDIVKIINKYYNDSKIILEKDYSNKERYIFIINE